MYSYLHCRHLTIRSSLHKIIDLGALKELHDLLHDLRVHALGLLELLAITVDDSGGSLGDTEVLLQIFRQSRVQCVWNADGSYPCVGLLADVDLVGRGGAGELLGVSEKERLVR